MGVIWGMIRVFICGYFRIFYWTFWRGEVVLVGGVGGYVFVVRRFF